MRAKLRKTVIVLATGILVAAVIAAILVNRYRDSIALEVANRVLADSQVAVTDVSVESIGTESVDFAQILLQP